MILIGIGIGVVFMICLIISFMVGYGVADQKYNPSKKEE